MANTFLDSLWSRSFAAMLLLVLLVMGSSFAGDQSVLAQEGEPPAVDTAEKPEAKAEDGKDGEKGIDGLPGEDGTDGTSEEPSEPEAGEPGDPGDSGEPGDTGEDGGLEEGGEDGGDATDGEDGESGGDGGDGVPGEDGEDATEKEEPVKGDAEVETGDATSVGQIQNTGNTNVVNGNGGGGVPTDGEEDVLPFCSDKSRKGEGKGEKAESVDAPYCIDQGGSSGDTKVDNENTAEVNNEAEIEADTGGNAASQNNGNGSIYTGNAQAFVDIFNLVNTNVVDSNGLFVLLSNLKKQLLDIDLRKWAPYMQGYDGSCGEGCYRFGDLEIRNNNNGMIKNSIVVRADTGGNDASGNTGDGSIQTGNAYAAANVINIANTNIIDSNYLLFVANNFGSLMGDIVFPNASSFFNSLWNSPSKVYDDVEIANMNAAAISNSVGVGAETGGNEANGNGSGFVQTGTANSSANIFNQANMNLFGGNSFVALIRVSGDWTGNIFGLPEGISWKNTGQGVMLYSDDLEGTFGQSSQSEGEDAQDDGPPAGEGKGGKGKKGESSDLSVENNNTASITNDIQVFALTGDNKANGNGKGGSIDTGDAIAVANVVNIANTNVIGKNWLFAMFNILGDFSGNISFGRPDLWVGQRAEIPNDPTLPGDEIIYTFTVANNGDAVAHNVQLASVFDDLLFSAQQAADFSQIDTDKILWELGTLNPGEGLEVSFTGNIRSDIPYGIFPLTNTSSISATESDENTQDNADTVELTVFNPAPPPPPPSPTTNGNESVSGGGGGGGGSDGSSGSGGSGGAGGGSNGGSGGSSGSSGGSSSASASTTPNLHVLKNYSADGEVQAGDGVDYTVVITNFDGTSAYDAYLVDTLEDEHGVVINEEVWELGQVFPDEEITVTYTTVFAENTVTGMYYNRARVEAYSDEDPYGEFITSNTAIVGVYVYGTEQEEEPAVSEIEGDGEGIASIPFLGVQGETVQALPFGPIPQPQVSERDSAFAEETQSSPFLAGLFGFLPQHLGWLMLLILLGSLFLLFLVLRGRFDNSEE